MLWLHAYFRIALDSPSWEHDSTASHDETVEAIGKSVTGRDQELNPQDSPPSNLEDEA